MGYGFTLPQNPFDSVLLKSSPVLTPSQHSLLGEPLTGLYHLTPRNRTPENPSIYPPTLLTLIYILTSTPTEASRMPTRPTKPATKRNEISTHMTLLHALLRKHQNFPPALPEPQNSKQASAKIYADSQRSIILSAIAESKDIINSHATTSGLIHLQSALGKGGADTVFAAAIESCFGSADVEELTETGQEDVVFILYLCHLSLTKQDFHLPAYPADSQEATQSARELHQELFPAVADAAPAVFGGEGWTVELLHRCMEAYADMGIRFPEIEGLTLAGEYVVCLE